MEDTTFVDYMNQNWPENGPAPADAEQYIAREEGQDFVRGIYNEPQVTVDQFLSELEVESKPMVETRSAQMSNI